MCMFKFVFEKIPERYAVRSTVYQRKYRKGIPLCREKHGVLEERSIRD